MFKLWWELEVVKTESVLFFEFEFERMDLARKGIKLFSVPAFHTRNFERFEHCFLVVDLSGEQATDK